MSYNTVFLGSKKALVHPLFEFMYKKKIVKIIQVTDAQGNSGPFIDYNFEAILNDLDTLTTEKLEEREKYFHVLQGIKKDGLNTALECIVESEIIGAGPKIFRPKQLELEALENVEIRIPFKDYHQPFSTIIIEFPSDYAKRRTAQSIQGGTIQNGILMPHEHFIDTVAIHHDKVNNYIICVGYFHPSAQAYSAALFLDKGQEDFTIEEALKFSFTRSDRTGIIETTDLEHKCGEISFRVALNMAILLTKYGCKKIGPDNPSYYQRLQRYKQTETTKRQIRTHPIIYTLFQDVRLYRTERLNNITENYTGIVMGPHWRQGHWRNQRKGPGLTLTELIFIEPVFVNAHLFGGDASDINYIKR